MFSYVHLVEAFTSKSLALQGYPLALYSMSFCFCFTQAQFCHCLEITGYHTYF
ncbi:hypothetical protein COCC4DRAFT_30156 [Bipolaris maydis ATCC 48331]|uniref:Uncharacterized protein n=2 Tax=Cochliobolus heterostrophus TaxID=5016 RepID=M2UBW3_COCH5|nr:uncharacterized protein COCC4DRAFT_30156 [Bipolaris maydis ATCC 48331]EMD85483.1 hypothetical protein COCHEDRAFT_1024426 [Bipolaris maydis C5]EMD90433.1 hypothetical protein COCHEDRAFT_1022350 [Bipolaris maydis C5]ENI09354.1 hypothetical protein COCC4DRAFT_30156 [Bipolaris maydis ATCC 48331]KAJ6206344.1 hypothetical protein PSV09DRAFT_1022350 [Bipolaris maydis]